jgi:hypothetical protein
MRGMQHFYKYLRLIGHETTCYRKVLGFTGPQAGHAFAE